MNTALAQARRPPPADWPGPGPLNLALHDLPHASSDIEWWYQNTHLQADDGRRFGVFAAFFRVRLPDDGGAAPRHAHFLSWAVSDPGARTYHPLVEVDVATVELTRARLDVRRSAEWLRHAAAAVLDRGHLPLPTQPMRGEAFVSGDTLTLQYGAQRLHRHDDGTYELVLADVAGITGAHLRIRARKGPVRHGDGGVLTGAHGERMFYYFLSNCQVEGLLTVGGEHLAVHGTGWYDHEFGSASDGGRRDVETVWTWASLQLDSSDEVSIFLIHDASTDTPLDAWAVLHDAEGTAHHSTRFSITAGDPWRSLRTFITYHTTWDVRCDELGLSLRLRATHSDQEVVTAVSDPGFWEGTVLVSGIMHGRAVAGRGWVERKGDRFRSAPDLLHAAGDAVLDEISRFVPHQATDEHLRDYVSAIVAPDFWDTFDRDAYQRHLLAPIRELIDRGGKAWRSLAILIWIEMVGGDSRRRARWLALPEILHVGSLMVDDVEDDSDTRRGGPTCHRMYGTPLAINAGCAAYFLAEPPVEDEPLPERDKLRIYRLYFDAVRAAHAGQALDIGGLDLAVDAAAETGDVTALRARVLAIHRLKSGMPVAALARAGAILGGGTDEQVEVIGRFGESLGLAFQIVDDVLNLRGFKADLKTRGEDITQGKYTLPIIETLARIDRDARVVLVATLRSSPTHRTVVEAVITQVERTGANDACLARAHALVETAWRDLDRLMPDTQHKVLLRAISGYLLERHY